MLVAGHDILLENKGEEPFFDTVLRPATWNLPEKLHVSVRYQLDPAAAPAFAREVAVVHLASDMAANMAPSLKTDHEAEPYIPDQHAPHSMQFLGLTPAALAEIRLEAMAASLEVIEIMQPRTGILY